MSHYGFPIRYFPNNISYNVLNACYVTYYAKHLTCIISFVFHSNFMRLIIVHPSFNDGESYLLTVRS